MEDQHSQATEKAEPDEKPVATNSPPSKWQRRVQKFVWPIYARFPNVIPDPYGNEKEYWRERDVRENVETALGEGVSLRLGCIMVSEIYGPNEIEALYRGLERIGWDRGRARDRDESNVDWLKGQRLYGARGTLPLGWVRRQSEARRVVRLDYTADFPKEFSSLLVNIFQLTPSVTCLNVGFILTDAASLEYADEIDRPAQTTRKSEKNWRSVSILNVPHVKQERVQRVRRKYRELGISWLSRHFPGFFAEQCERSHFPTTEILALEGFTPFDGDNAKDRTWTHWSRFVNIDHEFDTWTCSSLSSLRFSLKPGPRDSIPNHITVALRCDTLTEEDKKHYGDFSLSSQVYFTKERVGGIVAKHALAGYLRELLRNLKETRQSLSLRTKSHRSTYEVTRISAFFRRSIGVPSVAREVLALSEDDASFQWDATGFTSQVYPGENETYEIKDALKSFLGRLAQQLLEEDQDTREFLNQLSSAMGTKESIAAQKRMEWVAGLALLVSAISLAFAIHSGFPQ